MKCVDENMEDKNLKERDSYEKSIIRRLVEDNGDASQGYRKITKGTRMR